MKSTRVISNVIRFVVCTYYFTITEMRLKRIFFSSSWGYAPEESFLQWVECTDESGGYYKKVDCSDKVFEEFEDAHKYLRKEMITRQASARKSADEELARASKDMTINLLD